MLLSEARERSAAETADWLERLPRQRLQAMLQAGREALEWRRSLAESVRPYRTAYAGLLPVSVSVLVLAGPARADPARWAHECVVRFGRGRLTVSKIYGWFEADFGARRRACLRTCGATQRPRWQRGWSDAA